MPILLYDENFSRKNFFFKRRNVRLTECRERTGFLHTYSSSHTRFAAFSMRDIPCFRLGSSGLMFWFSISKSDSTCHVVRRLAGESILKCEKLIFLEKIFLHSFRIFYYFYRFSEFFHYSYRFSEFFSLFLPFFIFFSLFDFWNDWERIIPK